MKQVFILIGLVALVIGLLAGFAGGYYYQGFRAAEDTDSLDLGGGSYFTQDPHKVIAVIDPNSKRPKFSRLNPVGSYSDVYTCPLIGNWRNVIPEFKWNGENLGKIFPLKLNTAETIIRKEIINNYSYGPLKKVSPIRGENDVQWFGEKYTWKTQTLDTNKDGADDYIEAVNLTDEGQGQNVEYLYDEVKPVSEDSPWPLESEVLGLTRIAQDYEPLKPIPLCKKATGSGE